jgi:hypothetical protein
MVHDISPNFRVILDRTSPDLACPSLLLLPIATVGGEAKRPAMALADERAIDANNFRSSRWPAPDLHPRRR